MCGPAHSLPPAAAGSECGGAVKRVLQRSNWNLILNGNTHNTPISHTHTPCTAATISLLWKPLELCRFVLVKHRLPRRIPWTMAYRGVHWQMASAGQMANGNQLSYTLAHILMALWHAKLPSGPDPTTTTTLCRGRTFFAVVFRTFPQKIEMLQCAKWPITTTTTITTGTTLPLLLAFFNFPGWLGKIAGSLLHGARHTLQQIY